jgi:hypothetical protein
MQPHVCGFERWLGYRVESRGDVLLVVPGSLSKFVQACVDILRHGGAVFEMSTRDLAWVLYHEETVLILNLARCK